MVYIAEFRRNVPYAFRIPAGQPGAKYIIHGDRHNDCVF